MSVDVKKVAAALTAVDMFMEEEALERLERAAPPGYPSLWAISGRQGIMNNRFLVTARMWK